jgi:hypothetical protein
MNESIDIARQKRVPFRVNRGQEIDYTITVSDSNGDSYDFTGHTARLEVYNSFNKTDSPEFVVAVTLATGTMRFTRAAITSKRENFVYKLFITDDTDYEQIWLNGPFLVLDSEYDFPDNAETLTISPSGDAITINVAPVGTDRPLDIKTVSEATYTVLESDNGKMIHYTNNAGVAITLPNGLSDSHYTMHVNKGSGDLTFSAAGTIESVGTIIAVQYSGAMAVHEGSNVWGLYGKLT